MATWIAALLTGCFLINEDDKRARQQAIEDTGGIGLAGIALGANHSCLWLTDGQAGCWGKADKGQVQAMIKVLLPGVKLAGSDAADALAVAITHAHHRSP